MDNGKGMDPDDIFNMKAQALAERYGANACSTWMNGIEFQHNMKCKHIQVSRVTKGKRLIDMSVQPSISASGSLVDHIFRARVRTYFRSSEGVFDQIWISHKDVRHSDRDFSSYGDPDEIERMMDDVVDEMERRIISLGYEEFEMKVSDE